MTRNYAREFLDEETIAIDRRDRSRGCAMTRRLARKFLDGEAASPRVPEASP